MYSLIRSGKCIAKSKLKGGFSFTFEQQECLVRVMTQNVSGYLEIWAFREYSLKEYKKNRCENVLRVVRSATNIGKEKRTRALRLKNQYW